LDEKKAEYKKAQGMIFHKTRLDPGMQRLYFNQIVQPGYKIDYALL